MMCTALVYFAFCELVKEIFAFCEPSQDSFSGAERLPPSGTEQGPLARLQLARAQAMEGDPVAAQKPYQDFLRLWQDADPNIPILIQAKVEYAKLNLTELRANDKRR